jgi:hypothetical protein
MSPFYTYLLRDPRTFEPIYVGKGTNGRIYDHWKYMLCGRPTGNKKLYNKLTSIFRDGYSAPIYEKLLECENEKACFLAEKFFVATFGRDILCNLTDGGEGVLLTVEQFRNRAESLRITLAKPEVKERYSRVGKAARARPGEWEKKSRISKEQKNRPGVKEKWYNSLKASLSGSDGFAKRAATLKVTLAQPAVREKRIIAAKAAFAMKTPEQLSERVRKAWVARRAKYTPEEIRETAQKIAAKAWITKRAKALPV